jgi:homocysteine S-methyltransferase
MVGSFSHRELWSSSLLLTHDGQNNIRRGHCDWLESGSDIITTVTYQCHYGLVGENNDMKQSSSINSVFSEEQTMTAMIQDGVTLAKEAVATCISNRLSSSVGPFVVASTGPYGAAMADGSEYTGQYPPHVTREALVEFHAKKARALWNCQPDGLAVETIPNLDEVGVVCEVLRDLKQQQQRQKDAPPIACWISLACRNGKELNDGHSVENALRTIQNFDPDAQWINAIGINCCDSAHIASLVEVLTKHETILSSTRRRGIVVYPNSGESWDAAHEQWKDGTGTTDKEFADRLMEAVQVIKQSWGKERSTDIDSRPMPKVIMGGCCRTNPATIAALRQRVDAFQNEVGDTN